MICTPKTRAEIQKETGIKGKELTNNLKSLVRRGVALKRLVYVEPATSCKRKAVYQSIPENLSLI